MRRGAALWLCTRYAAKRGPDRASASRGGFHPHSARHCRGTGHSHPPLGTPGAACHCASWAGQWRRSRHGLLTCALHRYEATWVLTPCVVAINLAAAADGCARTEKPCALNPNTPLGRSPDGTAPRSADLPAMKPKGPPNPSATAHTMPDGSVRGLVWGRPQCRGAGA